MSEREKVDRLLHDLQHKIGGAIFALTLAPLPTSKDDAVAMLREADTMIDAYADAAPEGKDGTDG